MAKEENVHNGHRERMLEKVLNCPDSLCDHELLEILLYSFLPRIDTNAIAHRLLATFGDIKNLFKASPKELSSVKGIGKTTASKLFCLGKLLEKIYCAEEDSLKAISFDNYGRFKNDLIEYFSKEEKESFLVLMLDKKYKLITKLVYSNENVNSVSLKIEEISNAFVLNKPYYVLLCHNHPSGSILPSPQDDYSTAKIYMLCSIHGIILLDHVIISKNQCFSYYHQHDLENIKNKYRLDSLFKKSEE